MKKTFTINISGAVFHIEEDAYEVLQNYFASLKAHFGTTGEGKEIVDDIETRVAEIFSEEMTEKDSVITLERVNSVIETMGTVDEIEEEEEAMESESKQEYVGKKRLYRDPLHRYLGGVCGGLAAYFNTDRLLIRLLFFILAVVTQGGAFLAYIIMWIVVPKAITTRQRLEMYGREANIKNIENSVKSGFENVQEKYNNFKNSESYANAKSTFHGASKTVSRAGSSLGRIILVAIGIVLIIVSFLGLLGLISSLLVGGMADNLPFVWSPNIQMPNIMNPFVSPIVYALGLISIALVAGIPLLAFLYIGTKMVFRYNSNNKTVGLGMLGVWLLALGVLVVLSISQVSNYKDKVSVSQNDVLPLENVQTLRIDLNKNLYANNTEVDYGFNFDQIKVVVDENDKEVLLGYPNFDIEPSMSNQFVLNIMKSSRTHSKSDKKAITNAITYHYALSDSTLQLDPYFILKKGTKWRNQKVHVTLKVPKGKSVYLSKGMERIINDIDNVSNTYDNDMVEKQWKMESDGLTFKDSINQLKTPVDTLDITSKTF